MEGKLMNERLSIILYNYVSMQTEERIRAVSQEQSLTVVKNLIRTSISEICYLRNLFEDNCFSKKNYAGIIINALHPVENKRDGKESVIVNEEAWKLTRWLEEGVFDALEKRYLRGLVFAIYDNPEDKENSHLLETYSYAFNYPDGEKIAIEYKQNNAESSCITTDGVKNQAVILLRTLITMCNTLHPLPQERWITIQLYYYDDITPSEYQPKFFEDTEEAKIRPGDSAFVSNPFVIETGKLTTPYHRMCMKVRVTEKTLHDSCNTIEENSECRMEDEEMDDLEKRILQFICSKNSANRNNMKEQLGVKSSTVDRVLMSLYRQGYLLQKNNEYTITEKGRKAFSGENLASYHPTIPLTTTSSHHPSVVDIVAEPETPLNALPVASIIPTPDIATAAKKALDIRTLSWGTPLTEGSEDKRRVYLQMNPKRVNAIAKKRNNHVDSDEEYEPHSNSTKMKAKRGAKRSSIKEPINQKPNSKRRRL